MKQNTKQSTQVRLPARKPTLARSDLKTSDQRLLDDISTEAAALAGDRSTAPSVDSLLSKLKVSYSAVLAVTVRFIALSGIWDR